MRERPLLPHGGPTRRLQLVRPFGTAALAAIALFAQLGCVASGEADCHQALQPETLQAGVGFGGLRVGMSEEEVIELIGPAERGSEAALEYPSCGFAVLFDGERRVGALVAGDATGAGPELAEAFTVETSEGLGIGSSREEIVAAFGEPTETRGEGPEGQFLVYTSRGVTWLLREGRVAHLTIRRARQ